MKTLAIIKEIIFLILAALAAGAFIYGIYKFDQVKDPTPIIKKVDSLLEVNKTLVKFDSIHAARLNRFSDSLHVLNEKLETEKNLRHAQDQILQKKVSNMLIQFNSIDLPVRPEFKSSDFHPH